MDIQLTSDVMLLLAAITIFIIIGLLLTSVLVWKFVGPQVIGYFKSNLLLSIPEDFKDLTNENVTLYRMHKSTIFAFRLVTFISLFAMFMSMIVMYILTNKNWCPDLTTVHSAIIQMKTPTAPELNQYFSVLQQCVSLQRDIISTLGMNGYVFNGTITLAMVVLIVVVIAQAHLKGSIGPKGLEGEITDDNPNNP